MEDFSKQSVVEHQQNLAIQAALKPLAFNIVEKGMDSFKEKLSLSVDSTFEKKLPKTFKKSILNLLEKAKKPELDDVLAFFKENYPDADTTTVREVFYLYETRENNDDVFFVLEAMLTRNQAMTFDEILDELKPYVNIRKEVVEAAFNAIKKD